MNTFLKTLSRICVLAVAVVLATGCPKIEEPTTVAVTGVSLDKTEISLTEGAAATLTATITPSNATNKTVAWSSSDPSVATVENGNVKAVKAGTTNITVTTVDGGKTATCKVTVSAPNIPVTGVTLTPTEVSLVEGTTTTLTATVKPDNATIREVTWKTSDAAVATVDKGVVTAVKAGKATITVTTVDGYLTGVAKSASCQVTVTPGQVAVQSVTVTPATLELTEGTTATLTATVSPDNATNKDVEWRTTNDAVAKVENGVVSAIAEGKAKIFAQAVDGGAEAFCEVTVKKDDTLKGIAFFSDNLEIHIGQSRTLELVFTPSYAANKNVTFSSSDPAVASVDGNGTVTGLKEGSAVITATSEEGGFTATCTILVSPAVSTGIYYNLGWKLMLNGEETGIWAPYSNCMDPEGNVYYSRHDGVYDKLSVVKNGDFLYMYDAPGTIECTKMGAGGGYVFFPYTHKYQRNLSLYRFADNGDGVAVNFDLYSGSQSFSVAVTDVVADASGNAYVIATATDEYNVNVAVMWKISVDGTVTRTDLSDGSRPAEGLAVCLSASGDVYCLATDGTKAENGDNALFVFKNGKKAYEIPGGLDDWSSINSDIDVHGSDVYVFTTQHDATGTKKTARLYKNGTLEKEYLFEEYAHAGDLFITPSGDIYATGYYDTGTESTYLIWKNGIVQYTSDDQIVPRSLMVKE